MLPGFFVVVMMAVIGVVAMTPVFSPLAAVAASQRQGDLAQPLCQSQLATAEEVPAQLPHHPELAGSPDSAATPAAAIVTHVTCPLAQCCAEVDHYDDH